AQVLPEADRYLLEGVVGRLGVESRATQERVGEVGVAREQRRPRDPVSDETTANEIGIGAQGCSSDDRIVSPALPPTGPRRPYPDRARRLCRGGSTSPLDGDPPCNESDACSRLPFSRSPSSPSPAPAEGAAEAPPR